MRFTKDMERQLVAANPYSEDDLKRWPNSEEAVSLREKLDRKVAGLKPVVRKPRWKLVTLPVVAALALSLAGAGWAITHRAINDPRTVGCFGSFSQTGDLFGYRLEKAHQSPVSICHKHWKKDWKTPVPGNLVECITDYPDGQGGGIGVFPAPEGMSHEDACAAIGAALPPPVGVTGRSDHRPAGGT